MRAKRGLAGLASVGAVLLIGALAPSAAMAHPCISEAEAAVGSTFTLHTGGDWAGNLPEIGDLAHECADDLSSYIYRSVSETSAEGEPIGDAISTFAVSRLRGLGYSARNVPMTGTGSGVYNSDLAFKDNLVIQGTYDGFRIVDFTDKSNPTQLSHVTNCTVPQGDVVVYGNILVRSWDSAANASAMCGGQLVGQGFEGIHIFDISNPAQPQFVRGMRFSQQGMPAGALLGCGSHTATAVPDPARDALYIYNGGSSNACSGIDIFKIKISDPSDATVIRRASNGRPGESCHDNNVLMGVGGTSVGYAMCAGGDGLSMYAFDMSKPAGEAGTVQSPGGVENPTLLWSKVMPGVDIGHSGSFTYDGKLLIFGHEPGGGTQARCQATSTVTERTLFFLDPQNGDVKGTMLHPRPQTSRENCTWHNFNVVPTEAGYFATVGSYQSGISVFEFTNPAAPRELAYADPAPLQVPDPPVAGIISGGDWSTYWHNGYIYESDMKRGVISWELNLPTTGNAAAGVAEARAQLSKHRSIGLSNPQTQTGSYQQNPRATIAVRSPAEGAAFKQGAEVLADFDCSDDTAVVSCVGTVVDGAAVNTSTLGNKVFRVTAQDSSGSVTTKDVPYMVNSVDYTLTPTSNVDTTMALVLPATSPSFGTFLPGTAREYFSTAALQLTSTAGNAAVSIHDPAATGTGRLVNGTATLTQPLSVFGASTNAAATAGPGGALGGAAAPTQLVAYNAPVTNSALTLTFRQAITATETLRSGAYSKTLTITLSTTAP